LAGGLATGERLVRVWNARTGQERAPLGGHTGAIFAVAFSPNSRTLASAGTDGARLWDVETGQQQGEVMTGHAHHIIRGLVFSPDGRSLLTGGFDRKIRNWDVSKLK